ncbi:hypothetical protein [Nocardiopsis halophila]|uniref:hypothetical protein n=1 Tax=Nocardiopsis halophila TaxID=141692 RepID=UPI00187D92FE|nr:hypothetical protein [Nocardiopsis halophila]
MGESTCAGVVPRDAGAPPTLREVRSALAARGVAAYKLPDHLVVRTDLPLAPVGKTDKKALWAQVLGGGASG